MSGALCIWTITVPVGKIVKLTFEDFSITMEESSSDCNFVEIRDSLLPNGPVLARSSCDTETAYLPVAVYSTGRYMWVKFHSYYSFYSRREEDRGFKAHFEAFDPVGKFSHISCVNLEIQCFVKKKNLDSQVICITAV